MVPKCSGYFSEYSWLMTMDCVDRVYAELEVNGRLGRVVVLRICAFNDHGPEFLFQRVPNLITSSDNVYLSVYP